MIDPNWSLVDLDPVTWRNIGRFFDPGQYIRAAQPDEHGLFVLHDGGRTRRVVDTQRGVRHDLALDSVADPQALAQQLYARGEWQRVHVIDQRHLAHVAREAQATPRRDLTLDQYYRLIYNLLWGDARGYVSVPPRPATWNGWSYDGIKAFIDTLPDLATVALGVLDGATVAIGLIFDVCDGLIRTVTTFETFGMPAPTFELSRDSFERLWSMLDARAADGAPPPAAVLLCSQAAFDAWIAGDDKLTLLTQFAENGAAFWRIGLPKSEYNRRDRKIN